MRKLLVVIVAQPNKIRKENIATVIAEWGGDEENQTEKDIQATPEFVLQLFKRISDEDVNFMGFSRYGHDQNGLFVVFFQLLHQL